MKTPITVQILAQNGETYIRRCLESVTWAEHIQVIDGGSTDRTRDIAAEYTDSVHEHPYENYGNQQNWGIPHARHDWLLVVDSDEWVSTELRDEIQRLLAEGPACNGYWVRRVSYFLGAQIHYSGWQNDTVLRLFNRTKGGFKVRNVHSDAEVEAPVGRLTGVFYHAPYRGVVDYVNRVQRYTTWGGQELAKQGRRVSIWQIVSRPPARFLRGYVLRLGFLDGWRGLVLAMMTSTYVLLKYLKAYEIQNPGKFDNPDESPRA